MTRREKRSLNRNIKSVEKNLKSEGVKGLKSGDIRSIDGVKYVVAYGAMVGDVQLYADLGSVLEAANKEIDGDTLRILHIVNEFNELPPVLYSITGEAYRNHLSKAA